MRCEAILALVKYGPTAGEAVSGLAELERRDPDPQVRRYAARALEKLVRGQ